MRWRAQLGLHCTKCLKVRPPFHLCTLCACAGACSPMLLDDRVIAYAHRRTNTYSDEVLSMVSVHCDGSPDAPLQRRCCCKLDLCANRHMSPSTWPVGRTILSMFSSPTVQSLRRPTRIVFRPPNPGQWRHMGSAMGSGRTPPRPTQSGVGVAHGQKLARRHAHRGECQRKGYGTTTKDARGSYLHRHACRPPSSLGHLYATTVRLRSCHTRPRLRKDPQLCRRRR